MFKLNAIKSLDEGDLYENTKALNSEQNSLEFAKVWQREANKKSPSLFKAIVKMYGAKIMGYGFFFSIIESTAR
jgi:hypothetical protein